MGETKQISIMIDRATWIKLLTIKKRTRNSIVSLIRTAIDEYLQRNASTLLIPSNDNE